MSLTNHDFLNRYHADPYAMEKCLTVLLEEYWKDSSRKLGREIPPVTAAVPLIRKFLCSENTCDIELIERVVRNRKDRDAVHSSCVDVDEHAELEVDDAYDR